jgi:hypothetical protein
VEIRLFADGGVGGYSFVLLHGALPRGLRIHGSRLSGKTTDRTRSEVHVKVVGVNPYGGAVFGSLTLHVH